jgi:hypothetical protein
MPRRNALRKPRPSLLPPYTSAAPSRSIAYALWADVSGADARDLFIMTPYNRAQSFRARSRGRPPLPAEMAMRIGLLLVVALAVALAAQLGLGGGAW